MLFAPHVGISPSGEVGKYHREGQDHLDSACGAAVGAFKKVCTLVQSSSDAKVGPSELDYLDYQFEWIVSRLREHYDTIAAGENTQAALVKVMYSIIHDFVEKIVYNLPQGKLIVLGGIQINMPKPGEDLFQPLLFEVREGDKKEDLLASLLT